MDSTVMQCAMSRPTSDRPFARLMIHALTLEQGYIGLEFLIGLPDNDYKSIHVRYFFSHPRSCPVGTHQCPLGTRNWKILVPNAKRRIEFYYTTLSPKQCRILANLGFDQCAFEDEGATFVASFAQRQDKETGPSKLSFRLQYFNKEGWLVILNTRQEKGLRVLTSRSSTFGRRVLPSLGNR